MILNKSQIKGKESENFYQELKSSSKDRHGRLSQSEEGNVCEHMKKTASLESLRKVPPGGCEKDGWREII